MSDPSRTPARHRRPALALLVALLTALLVGPAAGLTALPAAAAPNVPVLTMSPLSPRYGDDVSYTVTVDGCGGQQPWNVYLLIDSRPYTAGDRRFLRFNNGVLSNGGDTWTASVTFPGGALEAGPKHSYAYGIGPCFSESNFVDSNAFDYTVAQLSTFTGGTAPATATAGDRVPVGASVIPSSAGGSVTVTDGAQSLGSATLTAGSATVTAGPLSGGTRDLVVRYDGDRNHAPSTSAPLRVEVARAPSAISVTSSPTTPVFGAPVALTVTGVPGSTGRFDVLRENGVLLATGTLTNGTGTTSINGLGGGVNDLVVSYAGSGDHLPSTATHQVVVARAAAPLTVTPSPVASVRGQSVVLTVSGPAGSAGPFEVREGAALLASGSLANGTGTATLSGLPVGGHDLLVTYAGSTDFLPSSATTHLDVARAPSPLTTTTSPAAPVFGDPVVVAVTGPAGASGPFEVRENGALLATGALTNGTGSAVVTGLPGGPHALLVSYAGSTDQEPSTAGASVVVAPAAAPLTLGSTPVAPVRGEVVVLTVTGPAGASGAFDVREGGTVLATGVLTNGTGSATVTGLAAGSHDLLVGYAGSTDHLPSSASTSVVVGRAAGSVSVVAAPTSSLRGQPVVLDVTGPAGAGGALEVSEDGDVLATGTLAGGTASVPVVGLPAGTHDLLVTWAGDSQYTTATATASVAVALRPTAVALTGSREGSTFSLSATVAGTAGAPVPTGIVRFLDGTDVAGEVALADGVAELVLPSAAAGTHQLVATYLGSDDDATSTSTRVALTVPSLTADSTTVSGRSLLVRAAGFAPRTEVEVRLDGVLLATVVTGDDGVAVADVAVPASMSGSLVLSLSGLGADGGDVLLEQPVLVQSLVAPPTSTPVVPTPAVVAPVTVAAPVSRASTTSAALPRTGGLGLLPLSATGLAAVLAGAALVARARRLEQVRRG